MSPDSTPYRTNVPSSVEDVYHAWLKAEPSNYPPNLHNRVQSKEGKIEHQDLSPVVGITRNDYIQFHAYDAKYTSIIWEFTPGGNELKECMVLQLSE
jgi:hypothetical protein